MYLFCKSIADLFTETNDAALVIVNLLFGWHLTLQTLFVLSSIIEQNQLLWIHFVGKYYFLSLCRRIHQLLGSICKHPNDFALTKKKTFDGALCPPLWLIFVSYSYSIIPAQDGKWRRETTRSWKAVKTRGPDFYKDSTWICAESGFDKEHARPQGPEHSDR